MKTPLGIYRKQRDYKSVRCITKKNWHFSTDHGCFDYYRKIFLNDHTTTLFKFK